MKRKTILSIIIILIIIAFIWIIYYDWSKTLEEEIGDCSKDIDCITKLAIENLNKEICNEIGIKYDVTQCAVEVTIAKGNITECGIYSFEQEYCENQILDKKTK